MSLPHVFASQVGTIPLSYLDDNFNALYASSGASGSRPTPTQVGQTFFDTTLSQPIWCKQVSPAIWVNSAGSPV